MASRFQRFRLFILFIALTLGPGAASADSWTLVPNESEIRFKGKQTGNSFEGVFEAFSVEINYDPTQPENAYVRANIETGSAKTGDTQRDEALPGKDWFFSSMFPVATFEAQGFTPIGGNGFSTDGRLMIKGVEKDLTLPFTLTLDNTRAVMSAEVPLNRNDFTVGAGPWAEGKWVGLDVTVSINITAERAAQ